MASLGTHSLAVLAGVAPATLAAARALADLASAHGADITITSGLRTRTHQAQLYADSLANAHAGLPFLPAALPGRSLHERGAAFDIAVLRPATGLTAEETYKLLADLAPTLGLRPGYYFRTVSDPVHFELADAAPADAPAPVTATATARNAQNERVTVMVVVAIVLVMILSTR